MMGYTLRYSEELRAGALEFSEFKNSKVDPDRLSLTKELLQRNSAKFDPTKFKDDYRALQICPVALPFAVFSVRRRRKASIRLITFAFRGAGSGGFSMIHLRVDELTRCSLGGSRRLESRSQISFREIRSPDRAFAQGKRAIGVDAVSLREAGADFAKSDRPLPCTGTD